jgi:hypothetical protein
MCIPPRSLCRLPQCRCLSLLSPCLCPCHTARKKPQHAFAFKCPVSSSSQASLGKPSSFPTGKKIAQETSGGGVFSHSHAHSHLSSLPAIIYSLVMASSVVGLLTHLVAGGAPSISAAVAVKAQALAEVRQPTCSINQQQTSSKQ